MCTDVYMHTLRLQMRLLLRTCLRLYLRLSLTHTLPRACVPDVPYSGEHVPRGRGGWGIFEGVGGDT